jgi:hypothetical protein
MREIVVIVHDSGMVCNEDVRVATGTWLLFKQDDARQRCAVESGMEIGVTVEKSL